MSKVLQDENRNSSLSRTVPSKAILQELGPGLLLVLAVAVPARIGGGMNKFVPDAVIALILGTLVNNVFSLPWICRPGIQFTHHYLLRTAIILLGTSLSFAAIVRIGGETLVIIVVCLAVSFSLCLLAARLVGLSKRIGVLLGAGTSICGATAILTVGPLVAATEAEIAYAVGTIFSYNALAVIFYPWIGHLLNLSSLQFGTWAGTAINDTSAVVATGYIYSDAAGVTATVVKLTRTVLLVPMAVLVGIAYALQRQETGKQRINILKLIPWFVLAFLGMVMLNTLDVFPAAAAKNLTDTAKFLIVMVLASVGLGINLRQMGKLGVVPFLIGLIIGALMGAISLALQMIGMA